MLISSFALSAATSILNSPIVGKSLFTESSNFIRAVEEGKYPGAKNTIPTSNKDFSSLFSPSLFSSSSPITKVWNEKL